MRINNILIMGMLLGIFMIGVVSASVWPSINVCCEKTQNGAWCQNTLESNCAAGFRISPTSCEATSFCKPGCCVDSQEGLCMENTPQKVCDDSSATWVEDKECNVPQCDLGCCVLGDQASFVTLTRCKKLSGVYGLQTDFRKGINDELSCISVAYSQEKGACIYESEFQRTCKFTTRTECLNVNTGVEEENSGILGFFKKEKVDVAKNEFFSGYLCSADELATNCGPTTETSCLEGKDEVYFLDSCGNPANIYDSSKTYDKQPSYWQKIVSKADSCNYGNLKGNAGSKTCGNCDYFRGSVCSKGSATYGDYNCNDLNCYDTSNGNDYKNGESWCVYQSETGEGKDVVGSRHFRHVCINGEEIIEPCADFRNEVCIQQKAQIDGDDFQEAACRINRWTDCIDQNEKEKCENGDKRDCYWQEGLHFTDLESSTTAVSKTSFTGGTTGGFSGGITGNSIFGGGDDDEEDTQKSTGVQVGGGACLPNTPPGLKFWNEGDASGICNLGNSVCVVEYEKKLIGDKKCVENCECLEDSWVQGMNKFCNALGDCGAYANIAGVATDDGIEWKISGDKQTISQGILDEAKNRAGVRI